MKKNILGKDFLELLGPVQTKNKEHTKMVTKRNVKCYQTFCRSKSKGINELVSRNSPKEWEYKDQVS